LIASIFAIWASTQLSNLCFLLGNFPNLAHSLGNFGDYQPKIPTKSDNFFKLFPLNLYQGKIPALL